MLTVATRSRYALIRARRVNGSIFDDMRGYILVTEG